MPAGMNSQKLPAGVIVGVSAGDDVEGDGEVDVDALFITDCPISSSEAVDFNLTFVLNITSNTRLSSPTAITPRPGN